MPYTINNINTVPNNSFNLGVEGCNKFFVLSEDTGLSNVLLDWYNNASRNNVLNLSKNCCKKEVKLPTRYHFTTLKSNCELNIISPNTVSYTLSFGGITESEVVSNTAVATNCVVGSISNSKLTFTLYFDNTVNTVREVLFTLTDKDGFIYKLKYKFQGSTCLNILEELIIEYPAIPFGIHKIDSNTGTLFITSDAFESAQNENCTFDRFTTSHTASLQATIVESYLNPGDTWIFTLRLNTSDIYFDFSSLQYTCNFPLVLDSFTTYTAGINNGYTDFYFSSVFYPDVTDVINLDISFRNIIDGTVYLNSVITFEGISLASLVIEDYNTPIIIEDDIIQTSLDSTNCFLDDSIYGVNINNHIQFCVFINCYTACQVLSVYSKCELSDLLKYYTLLELNSYVNTNSSSNCLNDCEGLCEIYKQLYYLLNKEGCKSISNCFDKATKVEPTCKNC